MEISRDISGFGRFAREGTGAAKAAIKLVARARIAR
jgi:hypothetical protein